MKNRKERYQQRLYKYEDQQRVPEYFEDPYDPMFDYWREKLLKRIRRRRGCKCSDIGSDYCSYCGKYINADDWISVDSNPDQSECQEPVKEKKTKSAPVVVRKHSPNINRYAALEDEEEEASLNMVEERKKVEENILNEQAVEDESDWKVYHSKYALKCIKMIESETAAYKQKLADTCKWIDSWHYDDTNTIGIVVKDDDDEGTIFIHTDGFFRRNRKAGYGVIIRNRFGVPIVGSSGVFDQGKPVSPLYHVLQGINRGLELAIKYGLCKNVTVYCSSRVAANLIISRFGCREDDGSHGLRENDPCRRCHIPDCSEKDFELLMYPLIQEILEKSSMFSFPINMFSFPIYKIKRGHNKVADYLAKLGLKKEEINPHDFSQELKHILREDVQGGGMMHHRIQYMMPW